MSASPDFNAPTLCVSPEEAQLDAHKLERVTELIEHGRREGMYPAATALVLRNGVVGYAHSTGQAQPDSLTPTEATLHTVWDMASVSKPIAATLLLQCVEEGRVHLGMRVFDFFPETKDTPLGPVTLRQIATHTSGLPAWKPLYKTRAASAVAEIFETPLEAEPGTHYTYSDLGYILIGTIVARLLEKPLNEAAQERIFGPLGMTRTGYCPAPTLRPETAATANCPMREGFRLVGEVHDANAHSLGGVSGHAGLFSPAPDMARFALAIQPPHANGQPQASPLLGPLTRKLAAERQTDAAVGGHSIGWFTTPNGMLPNGDLLSNRCFGHTGFTGTLLVFDPQYDLILILLTNRVYYPVDGTPFLRLRRLFANAVASALLNVE